MASPTCVYVTRQQVDEAERVAQTLIDAGRNETDGDYTNVGGLYYILEALNIRLELF